MKVANWASATQPAIALCCFVFEVKRIISIVEIDIKFVELNALIVWNNNSVTRFLLFDESTKKI